MRLNQVFQIAAGRRRPHRGGTGGQPLIKRLAARLLGLVQSLQIDLNAALARPAALTAQIG